MRICEVFKFQSAGVIYGALVTKYELFPSSPEVGWEVHRDYWRQGYGTEMGKTMLRLGFDILGLRRITTCCNARNRGSFRIMEKIGMRREAHFIKA